MKEDRFPKAGFGQPFIMKLAGLWPPFDCELKSVINY